MDKKSISELLEELQSLRQEQMKLRLQHVARKSDNQVEKTHLIRKVRRDIARVKTLLSQQNVKV